MAVEYAKDRQQFGRPIGAYQAVSHRCAQMLLETENSRSAVYGAAWAADAEPESLPLAASMAKAYASDAGWRVPDASIQVHGGIGFTWEHDLHFFLKRGQRQRGDVRRRQVAPRAGRRRGPRRRRRAGRGLSLSRVSALDRISVAAIGTSVADLEAETQRAEAAGVECVWAPELFRSAVTQAAYLAAKTETIGVATGIVWAFTRSPFILAVSALDIDEMSGGRFRLGLGSGVKRLNETWHNAEYGKPGAAPARGDRGDAADHAAGRQRASRSATRASYYDIDIKGWVRPHPAPRESVPIYTAGVQGGMCRMAGDVADGLIGHPIQSLRWIDEVVVASFEEGLSRSGRERGDFDYLPTVCCAIDDDEARAIEMARRTISFYATVKTYMPLWELHGFADNAVAAGEAFRRGDLAARPGGDQRRDGRDLLRRRPARQGPRPGRGDRRARRRPLPHPADLLHLPRGAERVPEPHHRRLRPERG